MKKSLILSAACILFPLFVHAQIQPRTQEYKNIETYFQYVPMGADFVLGFLGTNTQSEWYDRLIKIGVGFASEFVITQTLKAVVYEPRPDKSANNSFPSGHTATAFLGAELIRQDYGWGWGAGAYALATGVGIMRVVHNRHYWHDALAGAGVGILSAQIGRWTCKPIKNLLGIKGKKEMQLALMPTADPYSGAYCASLVVKF
ncbi:MAG: phosphatase PAP2 family protein [Bacteroidales bacterium]|nr:phosphatase PAP2 family protein [Candidatus Cryptobacteroides fimicaballi]